MYRKKNLSFTTNKIVVNHPRIQNFFISFFIGMGGLFLIGCDKQKESLKGERESIAVSSISLKEELENIPILLPESRPLKEWGQVYPAVTQGVLPLTMKDPLVMSADYTVEGVSQSQLWASPVFDGKCVYVLDGKGVVSAYSQEEDDYFAVKWHFSIVPPKMDVGVLGGGISCDEHSIYIGSPYGEVICLNSQNGEVRWRKNIGNPIRCAPLLKGTYGVVLTINNETEAFSLSDGHSVWTHQGMNETAGLLKTNPMVADENVVVIAYSSGEVYALRLENGHPLWSYSLTDTKGFDTRSLLMPIAAYPVIYQGYVFISSQGNKLICINLCSGKKVWEKEMVNIKEPIICGGYLYIIGNNRDLLCFYALTGKLIWKESLKQPTSIVEEKEKVILDKEEAPQDKKAEDQPKKEAEQDKMEKEEPVKWGIPLVINNQVFIPNAEGKGCYYSALTGQWVKEIDLPGPTFLPPLVLEDRVYFLSDNGLLSLWK